MGKEIKEEKCRKRGEEAKTAAVVETVQSPPPPLVKKLTVKRNYHTGIKNELITLLHITGAIPYKDLRILRNPPTMYQRAVKQMIEDEAVNLEKRAEQRVIYLRDVQKQNQKYLAYIDPQIVEYYLTFSNRNLWKISKSDRNGYIKALRDIEAQLIMYKSGSLIGPYAKDLSAELIGEKEDSYYTSREIKRTVEYNAGRGKNTGINKKISSSRLNGFLVSGGGYYAIYNFSKKNMEWKRFSELKMAMYLVNLIRNRSELENDARMKREAILISGNDKIFEQICSLNYEKNRNYKVTLVNVDYAYDHMYAVPKDENGILLLRMLKTARWKYIIKNTMLRPEWIEDKTYISVPCDGYDREKDICMLVFCIPDLVLLKGFIARANLEENKEKFKIFCFSYQLPLLISLCGTKNVKFMQTDINTYYKKYFSGSQDYDDSG